MKTERYRKNRILLSIILSVMISLTSSCAGEGSLKTTESIPADIEITETGETTENGETTGKEEVSKSEGDDESTAIDESTATAVSEDTAEDTGSSESEDAVESDTTAENDTTAESEDTSGPEETQDAETTAETLPESRYHLWDYAYGERAMEFLRVINDNFPARVSDIGFTDTTTKDACGAWINQRMQEFGYSPVIQTFDHVDNKGSVRITSYIYRKTGGSSKRVVVGAHYDCAEFRGAEDNGTGVSLLLETAERFASINTDLTIDFCFFDGEEFRSSAGAYYYLLNTPDKENILLYINVDSIGAGDHMFAYGGEYENDVLVRDWGYRMAMDISKDLGIDLRSLPPLSEEGYRTPARTKTSDQLQFVREKIPYVYFEANAWVDAEGKEHHPNGFILPFYNTNDPAFQQNEGQIIHSPYDDLDILESMLPGRIRSHISDYSRILTVMLIYMNQYSPEVYGSVLQQ